MKSKRLVGISLAAICLTLSAAAYAQYHFHSWQKMNQTYGQNAYGGKVVICNWKCNSDYNNPHMTQTQGSSYCPMP